MSEYTKRLAEQRQNIWEQAKGLLDKADTEKRSLSAEEQVSYDKMSNDLTDLRSQIDKVAEVESANKAAEESLRKLDVPASGDGENEGDKFAADLRSFLKGESRGLAISAEQTTRSWTRAIEHRDLTSFNTSGTATPTAGGNTVPTSFYDRLVEYAVDTSGVLQASPTVLNTTSGEPLQIPTVTGVGAAAAVGQNVALAESDPTFGQVTLNAYKFGQLIQVTRELIDDSAVDLLGFIARSAGRNLGLALGPKLITGTGSGEPQGIVTAASSGLTSQTVAQGNTSGTVGMPTASDLIDLYFSVLNAYRGNASWVLKDSTMGGIRKLKDTTGQFLWQPGLVGGVPDTILGRPVYTDPNVAAAASGAKSVLFGDFSAYYVRLAGGVRFERSDEFAFSSDLVTFRAILRADAKLVDQSGAVKFITGAAS